jgi:hypothetical protein
VPPWRRCACSTNYPHARCPSKLRRLCWLFQFISF